MARTARSAVGGHVIFHATSDQLCLPRIAEQGLQAFLLKVTVAVQRFRAGRPPPESQKQMREQFLQKLFTQLRCIEFERAANSTARPAATGRRAQLEMQRRGPSRMAFSRADAWLMASNGSATSMTFFFLLHGLGASKALEIPDRPPRVAGCAR